MPLEMPTASLWSSHLRCSSMGVMSSCMLAAKSEAVAAEPWEEKEAREEPPVAEFRADDEGGRTARAGAVARGGVAGVGAPAKESCTSLAAVAGAAEEGAMEGGATEGPGASTAAAPSTPVAPFAAALIPSGGLEAEGRSASARDALLETRFSSSPTVFALGMSTVCCAGAAAAATASGALAGPTAGFSWLVLDCWRGKMSTASDVLALENIGG